MSASLYDKVAILPIAGLVIGGTLAAAITGPFRGSDAAPTYGEHVGNALVRGFTTHMRIQTAQ